MIQKMRRKVTALVLLVLFGVTVGIVFAINYSNDISRTQEALSSLQLIMDSNGRRPALDELPSGLFPEEGEEPDGQGSDLRAGEERGGRGDGGPSGQPYSDPSFIANLSNYYTVEIGQDNEILNWHSDRAELYSDEQVEEIVALVLASGETTGRIGSQYYMMKEWSEGHLLVFLDGRLWQESANSLLLASSVVGLAAFLILGLGAFILIRRMMRPVEETFEKQRQFIWDASHELKTPLAVISANAEALSGEVGESCWLDYIQSEVQRTNLLVKSLLELARMDQDAQVEKRAFDLSKGIMTVALPFESAVFEGGKTLVLDIPDGISYVGNEEMIKQLVVILIGNAMQYSAQGDTITVSLQERGERCVLRVHNTGMGIAQEDLPHIFERFYRADRAHNRENDGNGLGLAIAKKIVEAHKGRIVAESSTGNWACFTVFL